MDIRETFLDKLMARRDEYLLINGKNIREYYIYSKTQITSHTAYGDVKIGSSLVNLPSGRKIVSSEMPITNESGANLLNEFFKNDVHVFITLTSTNKIGKHEISNFHIGDNIYGNRVLSISKNIPITTDMFLHSMTLYSGYSERTIEQIQYTGWQDDGFVFEPDKKYRKSNLRVSNDLIELAKNQIITTKSAEIIDKIITNANRLSKNGNIAINCNAGLGRTSFLSVLFVASELRNNYRESSLEKLINDSIKYFQKQAPLFLYDDQLIHLYEVAGKLFPELARDPLEAKDRFISILSANPYEPEKSYSKKSINFGKYVKPQKIIERRNSFSI